MKLLIKLLTKVSMALYSAALKLTAKYKANLLAKFNSLSAKREAEYEKEAEAKRLALLDYNLAKARANCHRKLAVDRINDTGSKLLVELNELSTLPSTK